MSAAALLAAATDLFRGKIYNWLTFPVAVAGLVHGAWGGGLAGLGSAAAGLGLGLLLLGWMYPMGFMGAGDVKLLAALGAWMGPALTVETALVSIALGGVLALLLLAVRGKIRAFLSRAYLFLAGIFVKQLVAAPMTIDRSQRMAFGLPLAAAAILCAWDDPFGRLGWRLW
ncbi:MAG: prepilin peptidase [Bdellovibrionales bacterium]|nr:prepilin peptidase [Bdellovibrionales bacterium]